MHTQYEHGIYYSDITPDPLNQAINSLTQAIQTAEHTKVWYTLNWLLHNGSKIQWETRQFNLYRRLMETLGGEGG